MTKTERENMKRCYMTGADFTEKEKKEENPRTIFLCREVNKSTGKIAVYPVGSMPGVIDTLPFELSLRQHLHPELRYFTAPDINFCMSMRKYKEILSQEEVPDEKTLEMYGIKQL